LDSRITPLKDALEHADGYSFPSGHTAGAMSIWGTIAFYWWNNKFIRYISIALVLLVAFSRNYVGVHTPQDIIVSIVIGILVILISNKILLWVEKKSTRDVLLLFIILFLTAILYIYLDTKCDFQMLTDGSNSLVNPVSVKHGVYGKLGFLTGLFTGWLLERRFINFDIPSGNVLKRIVLILVGISIFVLLAKVLCTQIDNFIPYRFASFISRFLVALYITVGYPFVIKFIANR